MADADYHVALLNDPNDDIGRVRGKAANLINLIEAGFPILLGLVMPAEAFEAFLSDGELGEEIGDCLRTADFDDEESLSACSSRIKALIASSPMSPALDAIIGRTLSVLYEPLAIYTMGDKIGFSVAECLIRKY